MRKNKQLNPDATYSKKFLRQKGGNKKKLNRSRTGNFFMFIAGAMLVKKEKNIA